MENNIGDDFYNFFNKEWLDNTTIPDDYQRWSTFQELNEKNINQIKDLIEKGELKDEFNKIKILYEQYMNIQKQDTSKNLRIINRMIRLVYHSQSCEQLFDIIFQFDLLFGLSTPLSFFVRSDLNDSSFIIPHIVPSGLGLPDRDYYLLSSNRNIMREYIKFINNYSKLFNIKINAQQLFTIERILAEKNYTKVEKRDPHNLNHVMTFDEFINKYPKLKFIKRLAQGKLNVMNPKYTELINLLIDDKYLSIWKNYFIFKIIVEFHKYLSFDTIMCYFNFYDKIISGTKKIKPLWKQSLSILDENIGELVGRLFVKHYFNAESKNKAIELFNMVKAQLANYLQTNDWMDNITKQKAMNKLNKIAIKIGYSDYNEKDYTKLDIQSHYPLVKNIINIRRFNIKYQLEEMYKPINRNKWFMFYHSINAYYSPSYNEIVFPAGILQAPFFSTNQDIVNNFAGFGMIVGHEIIHGFDDQGSKFDENGNLNNWWTKEDLIKYKQKIEVIQKQYDQYVIEGTNVNGKLTLGENIADIGGFILSLNALKKYLDDNNIKNKDNYIRQFFISYSNIWKSKSRREDVLLRLSTDPHSPPKFRVNGVIRNVPDFYSLFNIDTKNSLYLRPSERTNIWT